jgi:hypothetical protein
VRVQSREFGGGFGTEYHLFLAVLTTGAKPHTSRLSDQLHTNSGTDFTTLQLHNYNLILNYNDYKYKQADFFTCLDFL